MSFTPPPRYSDACSAEKQTTVLMSPDEVRTVSTEPHINRLGSDLETVTNRKLSIYFLFVGFLSLVLLTIIASAVRHTSWLWHFGHWNVD